MPDYKKMYLELMHATEDAINLLIAAQQRAEDIYCESVEREEQERSLRLVPAEPADGDSEA